MLFIQLYLNHPIWVPRSYVGTHCTYVLVLTDGGWVGLCESIFYYSPTQQKCIVYITLNIVFFFDFLKIFRTLFSLGVSVCYTHQAGRKPALQHTWQSSENHKIFRKKHNIWWTPCTYVFYFSPSSLILSIIFNDAVAIDNIVWLPQKFPT